MSIRMVVTAGYGNGTFNGTIKDVTLRGYSIGAALIVAIYTADVFCNISPVQDVFANLSPARDVLANPSPIKEVKSG